MIRFEKTTIEQKSGSEPLADFSPLLAEANALCDRVVDTQGILKVPELTGAAFESFSVQEDHLKVSERGRLCVCVCVFRYCLCVTTAESLWFTSLECGVMHNSIKGKLLFIMCMFF